MFFHSWGAIGHVVLASMIVYLLIVAALRVVGEQALAKMSGYDMIVTITLGSVVATVAVSRDITISEGVAALLTLLGLQEIVRRLQSRFVAMHHLVREPPRVVVWDGKLLDDRLLQSNISADEVRAAVRKAGLRSLSEARAVVLENDGDWSVIAKRDGPSDESAFYGLPIPGHPEASRGDDDARAVPTSPRRLP